MQKVLDYIGALLRNYPALGAGVLNVVIVLAAKFGLHVSPAELTAVASVAAAILAAYVHQHVTPAVGEHEKNSAG